MVSFSLATLAFVEGAAVVVREGAESGLVEDAFETLVAAAGASEEAGSTGMTHGFCGRVLPPAGTESLPSTCPATVRPYMDQGES